MRDGRDWQAATTISLCAFRLDGGLYGFPVEAVREVSAHTDVTWVPRASSVVLGYLNLRGQIFLVLDPRTALSRPPLVVGDTTRLIVFKPAVGESFGVLVDRVADIVSARQEQIEWTPERERLAEAGQAGELIAGVAKLESELLVILRPESFLTYLVS
jgi:purine-binding chemotaxis protein CheW